MQEFINDEKVIGKCIKKEFISNHIIHKCITDTNIDIFFE